MKNKIPVPRTDLPASPRDILDHMPPAPPLTDSPRDVLENRNPESLPLGKVPPDAGRVEMPEFFRRKEANGATRFIEDFEERVHSNWYSLYFVKTHYCSPRKNREQWEQYLAESKLAHDVFMNDARNHAIYMGVPEKYAAKVVDYAWGEGHPNGLGEIFTHLTNLIEIFKD